MAQYKDGQYAGLDMGYIVLAVLRFFIEENHFKDRDVTYPMYEQFMRDFLADEIPGDDAGGLIQYIFDKLCNDISEGLPAEIEARQKQYEYYRDKLLTFKELGA